MRSDTIERGTPAAVLCERKQERMARSKKQVFSKVKAVKADARALVGTPPPERVLPDPKQKRATKPRYKETLADLLTPTSHPAGDTR